MYLVICRKNLLLRRIIIIYTIGSRSHSRTTYIQICYWLEIITHRYASAYNIIHEMYF